MLTNTSCSKFAKVKALESGNISLNEGFWKEVVTTISEATVPHLLSMFEDKTISHVLENFRICAGEAEGEHEGTVFGDGDFYKWMEAAIYSASVSNSDTLFDSLENYCELIARAQLEDGYISTKQIIGERSGQGSARMGDVNDFEIYNMGHLFTTACLYLRVTKKDTLMKVAMKAADCLEGLYKEAQQNGEVKTAVCPSHYMGLIELYRTTGDEKYLSLAQLAIELRDSVKDGTDDNQDRIALKEHKKIIGHAVRANYLYAGVADLYIENGDEAYLKVLNDVWSNLISQKIYITGGCGALYNGVSPYGNFFKDQKTHQAYGYEYQLPNITAYNETCASVGLVMWAYRMYLIEPKAEFMDWLERAMFNVNLSAIGIEGQSYFYENMLRRTKTLPYELVWPLERTEYIFSYCCPPNVARALSQVSEYFYTYKKDSVYCGLYGANEAHIQLDNGADFVLRQTTSYPYEGHIRFEILKVKHNNQLKFELNIRVPGWVKSGFVEYKSQAYDLMDKESSGFKKLEIEIIEGQSIELVFDMPVRLTKGHALIEEVAHQVAIERGPLVYCMEGIDVGDFSIDELMVGYEESYTCTPLEIKGRKIVALEGMGNLRCHQPDQDNNLYQSLAITKVKKVPIKLIPYFAWDNRGFGEMRIWFPLML